ncbi:MAG TPA: hypothetical protein DCE42_21175 [Myxococcales bacterium]|nr:hypothetical protein [Deltaproteobacteria bacterium]MBK07419.1 hypothetical protein [Deltaproteobacteria bacterium]MBU48854.1 hypothetical protein [Deltaproteobacteria bacterium]HAA57292.1 hypothetical protein [Myxococcales bacterium]|tara:strand:+ start:1937 stop:2668 length:732 start_codon:yes stop_codon:yes gene_type:complete
MSKQQPAWQSLEMSELSPLQEQELQELLFREVRNRQLLDERLFAFEERQHPDTTPKIPFYKSAWSFSIGIAMCLSFVGWGIWSSFTSNQNVYLSDGDHQFSFEGFENVPHKTKSFDSKIKKDSGRSLYKGHSKLKGTVDFTNTGSPTVTRTLLKRIKKRMGALPPCFREQRQRDPRFEGGTIVLTIQGRTGRIIRIRVVDSDYVSTALHDCLRRSTKDWKLPVLKSTQHIYFPLYIRKKRGRW